MRTCFTDSETINTQVISEIASTYGKQYTTDIKMKLLGTPEQVAVKIAIDEMHLPLTPKQFADIFRSKCSDLYKNVQLMPGIYILC